MVLDFVTKTVASWISVHSINENCVVVERYYAYLEKIICAY